MMRYVITILLIVGAVWGVRSLISYYDAVKAKQAGDESGATTEAAAPASTALPGLPPSLEASLQTAQRQGAAGLKNWLKAYRGYVSDPRLAAIELDYVVLLGPGNLKEARQVFAAVKQRTPQTSPVYPRIKQLEKTYQ